LSIEDACGNVCGIPEDVLYEAMRASVMSEGGVRIFPYNMFKWWSRRFSVLARLLAAGLITSNRDYLMRVIRGEVPRELTLSARGKLIYDPFCGAGTILVEAAKVGFDALGVDVNPVAVAIARNSFEILSRCRSEGGCKSMLLPLLESLRRTWRELKHLWVVSNRYLLVHLFLARCPPCRAPIWVSTKRRKDGAEYLVIDGKSGELVWLSKDELRTVITPKEPSIPLDSSNLPKVRSNYCAYAAEVLDLHSGQRFFVSLIKGGELSDLIRRHVEASMQESRELLRKHYSEYLDVRVPLLKETRRLLRYGVTRVHELFTPRQLLSLLRFVSNTEDGARELASLIAGNVARTASLLAFYYQPYSKVNPGLQIKSYWLPESPVELNPLAHVVRGPTVRTVGRGTIATYISKLARACEERTTEKSAGHIAGNATIIQHDCTKFKPPKNVFAVITDPPYPGLFNYKELSLLYKFFLSTSPVIRGGEEEQEIDVLNEQRYVKSMSDLAHTLSKLRKGTPVILLVGVKSEKYAKVLREIVTAFHKNALGLAKLYWFIGESYGRLGRTKSRGIFALIFVNGLEPRANVEEDLETSQKILEDIAGDEKLSKLIEPKHERRIISAVKHGLRGLC